MVAIKDMEMPTCCAECRMKKRCEQGIAGGWREDKRVDDCPLVEIVTCKECEHWKDSDGVYRRGIGAESKCPINIKEVFEGNFYCADAERRIYHDESNLPRMQ